MFFDICAHCIFKDHVRTKMRLPGLTNIMKQFQSDQCLIVNLSLSSFQNRCFYLTDVL